MRAIGFHLKNKNRNTGHHCWEMRWGVCLLGQRFADPGACLSMRGAHAAVPGAAPCSPDGTRAPPAPRVFCASAVGELDAQCQAALSAEGTLTHSRQSEPQPRTSAHTLAPLVCPVALQTLRTRHFFPSLHVHKLSGGIRGSCQILDQMGFSDEPCRTPT